MPREKLLLCLLHSSSPWEEGNAWHRTVPLAHAIC